MEGAIERMCKRPLCLHSIQILDCRVSDRELNLITKMPFLKKFMVRKHG